MLPIICAACSTTHKPAEHRIEVTGVDSVTRENIPITMVFINPSYSPTNTPVDTDSEIEQMAAYPKWRYDIPRKTMSVSYTNDDFEADVISWDYKPSPLKLEHGFSGPVVVIMEKK